MCCPARQNRRISLAQLARGVLPGLLILGLATPALGQDSTERIVNLKVVADIDFLPIDNWKAETIDIIRDSFSHFRDRFGIQFTIREFDYWKPETTKNVMNHYLDDLRKKVEKGNCDIVLGIISPAKIISGSAAICNSNEGYILTRDIKPRDSFESILVHELCHIFGAIDLKEKGSIMSGRDPGTRFDEFTRQVILCHKHRTFSPSPSPLSKDMLDELISLFKKRSELGFEKPELYSRLAILFLEKKDYDSALHFCAQALKENAEMGEIHTILGNIYSLQDRSRQAVDEYRKALITNPNSADVHCNLGLALAKMGESNEAEAGYKRALKLNPHYARAHANLGNLYLRQGKIEEAISECRAALEICPDVAEPLCTLGAALIGKYEPVAASPTDVGGAEWDPDLSGTIEPGGADKAFQEAIALCQKALSLKPDLFQAHNVLGIILALQKKQAEEEFFRALEIKPDYLEAHYNLALLYYTNGETEKVVQHLRRLLEINPNSGLGHQILARIFQAQKPLSVFSENTKK